MSEQEVEGSNAPKHSCTPGSCLTPEGDAAAPLAPGGVPPASAPDSRSTCSRPQSPGNPTLPPSDPLSATRVTRRGGAPLSRRVLPSSSLGLLPEYCAGVDPCVSPQEPWYWQSLKCCLLQVRACSGCPGCPGLCRLEWGQILTLSAVTEDSRWGQFYCLYMPNQCLLTQAY